MKIPIELYLRWIPQNRTTEGKNTNPPKKKKNTSRLTLPQETGEGFGWLSKRTTFDIILHITTHLTLK